MKLILIITIFTLATAKSLNVHQMNHVVPANNDEVSPLIDSYLASNVDRNNRLFGSAANNVVDDKTWNFVTEIYVVMPSEVIPCTGSLIKENYVLSARECLL